MTSYVGDGAWYENNCFSNVPLVKQLEPYKLFLKTNFRAWSIKQ